MTEQRETLHLSRPLSPRRLSTMDLISQPADEADLLLTPISNRRLNGALSQLCRLAHQLEPGKSARRSHFEILFLADRLYGERQDRRPKLGKFLHVRRLLIDRWWDQERVRKVVLHWDRLLRSRKNKAPRDRGFADASITV